MSQDPISWPHFVYMIHELTGIPRRCTEIPLPRATPVRLELPFAGPQDVRADRSLGGNTAKERVGLEVCGVLA